MEKNIEAFQLSACSVVWQAGCASRTCTVYRSEGGH